MNNNKYVGMDVHLATIVVLNVVGKCLMESIIVSKGSTIIGFISGLSGTIHVVFEEGTQSTWLYDLIKPRVAEVAVCNARRHQTLLMKFATRSVRSTVRMISGSFTTS